MDRTAFEDELRRVRAAFGNDTFAGVGLQARAASLEQAVDCALVAPTTAPVTAADLLSRRERDVVLLVARGLSNRQIAR